MFGMINGIASMVQDKKKVDPRLADIDINEMGFGADLSLWKFSKQPECVVGEEEVKKTVDYLKNVLNWTTPEATASL